MLLFKEMLEQNQVKKVFLNYSGDWNVSAGIFFLTNKIKSDILSDILV